MDCPVCYGQSVIIKDGEKRCQAKGCTYISFHPISYQNENRQFEGEKGTENRFTSLYTSGMNREKESKLDKNFYKESKVIKNLASQMKLSTDLVEKAEAKLIQILKIKYTEKERAAEEKDKEKNKDSITCSNSHIAAYSLWLACFDKKMYFKDVRIANEMGISKQDWQNIVKELYYKLKNYMSVPSMGLEHSVLRICTKHKIDKVEVDAMLKMVDKIKEAQIEGGAKSRTIAACVFWQIMIRSLTYNKHGQFEIRKYLSKPNRQDEEKDQYWTQKTFDCSYESMKKWKNDKLGVRLLEFIPPFATRMPEDKVKS